MVLPIPTEFHVFRRTQDTFKRERVSTTGCYPLRRPFQVARLPRSFVTPYRNVLQPQEASLLVWAISVSLPLLRKSHLLSFLQVLMFQFLGHVLPYPHVFSKDTIPYGWWFPHSEIFGSKLLTAPEAYRRLVPSFFIDS